MKSSLNAEKERNVSLLQVVSYEEWRSANDAMIAKEKEATRARDALNAERRRMPMTKIEKDYTFQGPDGPATLVDLFNGHPQLILYHFMFAPDWEEGCSGCSMFVDNLGHLAHLTARDTNFVLVSRAALEKLEAFKARMGWDVPWYSSAGSDFNFDFGVSTDDSETFGLSVFLRDGEDVYRTYFTTNRGVEHLSSNWALLDLTPFGRQETWEDSPAGRPQSDPYVWWRHHDKYGG